MPALQLFVVIQNAAAFTVHWLSTDDQSQMELDAKLLAILPEQPEPSCDAGAILRRWRGIVGSWSGMSSLCGIRFSFSS